ncbi:MAG: translocation/assembly module TamB domain-containing protein [Opitutaceae bacterium]
MRRTFRILGLLLLAIIIAGALMPWWMGAVLHRWGPDRGLEFKDLERIGYRRFALTDVVYRRPGVTVRAARIEGEIPVVWLGHRWWGRVGPVRVERWSVELASAVTPAPATGASGWLPLQKRLRVIKEGLQRWLPVTETSEGEIKWGQQRVALAGARWEPSGHLQVTDATWRGRTASGQLDWTTGDVLDLTLRENGAGAPSITLLSRGAVLTGTVTIWNNTVSLSSTHAAEGWLPREARIEAPHGIVPAERLHLAPAYSAAEGSFALTWLEGRLALRAEARATPTTEGEGAAPPLNLTVRAQGDRESVQIEQLEVVAPGVTARLSQPFVIAQGGAWVSGDSRFVLAVDLARQPWIDAHGTLDGELTVERTLDAAPQASLRLQGQKLAGLGWDITSLDAESKFRWPVLTVTEFKLQLADGAQLGAVGAVDLKSRTLSDIKVSGRLTRPSLARWLPGALAFESAQVDARMDGPLRMPRHEGKLTVERLILPALSPLQASLSWQGVGVDPPTLDLAVTAGASRINLAGRVGKGLGEITGLRWNRGEAEQLALASPVTVRWGPGFRVTPFVVQGATGKVAGEIAYGALGDVSLEASGFNAGDLADFLPGIEQHGWFLDQARLKATWDQGPLRLSGALSGRLNLGMEEVADVSVAFHGDAEGLWIDESALLVAADTAFRAKGRLPLTMRAFPTFSWKLDEEGPLELEAHSGASEALWQRLSRWTGIEVRAPQLDLSIAGSWRRPKGEITVQAAHVSSRASAGGFSVPTIDGLKARAIGDGDRLTLESFTARIAGQEIQASLGVELPSSRASWRSPGTWLAKALRGSIRMSDAEISALSPYLPGWFGPGGQLSLDLNLVPELQLSGTLQVRDATSVPLGALGVVRGIGGEVRFSGRRLEVVRLEGKSGGQPVAVTGKATWEENGRLNLDLSLLGNNVPLVRESGLLVRSDLALRLAGDGRHETEITGTARLHDSLILSDVRSLIPRSGPRGVGSRRAPYFSVQKDPLADWKLGVEITGPRFLRLRTPLFSGVASTRIRLGGTLGEPRAVGEVSLDEGSVTLPFATFRVQQGGVSLTEANPFDPQIAVSATGRRLGYDLRMEVAGSVAAPTVSFSSSPPLDSERVLLLVMAGEAPLGEINYSGQQRFVRLGTYLGQSLFSRISSDPGRAERFSLTSGERVSRQGRETYSFSYPLDERWSFVGEYDEFDEYNLGVKWRIIREAPPVHEPEVKTKP